MNRKEIKKMCEDLGLTYLTQKDFLTLEAFMDYVKNMTILLIEYQTQKEKGEENEEN